LDFEDYLLIAYIFLVFITGLGLSLSHITSVNPEYTTGVLTASSILFGFWFIMLQREPKNERFVSQVQGNLLSSLILLVLTVMLLYFTALSNSALLSEITLFIATMSFILNIFYVLLFLHNLD